MKISKIFKLNKTQHELDFVDIDIKKDVVLFLDPFFLSTKNDPWSKNASSTIDNFFQYVIDLIRLKEIDKAKGLFVHLEEPNETCLGMSAGKPRGNGVGDGNATDIFDAILKSRAIETGLVEDLEDTAIFLEGIDKDKVSDMTTNIIRKHLIEYTQSQCELWGIPLTNSVASGFFWDRDLKKWASQYEDILVIDSKPILLVPKGIVSFYKICTAKQYHQHHILNFLQGEHLSKNTNLVQIRQLKNGTITRRVTKKDLSAQVAPPNKEFIRQFTEKHPTIFQKFKEEIKKSTASLKNEEIEELDEEKIINYLIDQLNSIIAGPSGATDFHNLMIGILEFMFYPNLINPHKEKDINDGRKRIDITFDNAAKKGTLYSLHDVHKITCPYLFFECKNYNHDPKNPELDQLIGRFSVNRSMVGFLVCRKIDNKKLFLQRCKDTWKDKKELIIPTSDEDVISILSQIRDKKKDPLEEFLANSVREIILG